MSTDRFVAVIRKINPWWCDNDIYEDNSEH